MDGRYTERSGRPQSSGKERVITVNLRFKLLSTAGALVAAAGISMAPVSAAGVQLVVFQGTATGVNVQLVGGSGSYSFSQNNAPVTGTPLCEVAFEVSTDVDAEAEGCTVNATGTYANIVCGTGTTGGGAVLGAGDTATLGGEPEPTAPTTTIKYGITFVASLGVVVGSASGEDSGTVVGVVQIAPAAGNCVAGVTAFTATVVTAGVG